MGKATLDIEHYLLNEHFLNWVTQPTPELTSYWENWIADNPSEKDNILKAQRLIANLQFDKHKLDANKRIKLFQEIEKRTTGQELNGVFENIRNYVEGASGDNAPSAKIRSLKLSKKDAPPPWRRIMAIAASLLMFISTVALVYFFTSNNWSTEVKEISYSQTFIKKNPKGKKLTTYLPDGTKVILNSNSQITYMSDFGLNERRLQLEGEAFFEVVKDSSKAFVVVSGGVVTMALGTSFNVRSVKKGIVEVALVTGKVKVQSNISTPVVLLPGKAVTILENKTIKLSEFDYQEVIGWKDGVLVFKNNSLPEIIDKLENWYGVEINSELSINQHFNYSGINENESLDEVLNGISFVHHFNYEINGNTVRVY